MKRLSYWEVRTTTLTTKGQLTVPVAICRHHGLKPGDKLAVTIDDEDSFRVVSVRGRKATSV